MGVKIREKFSNFFSDCVSQLVQKGTAGNLCSEIEDFLEKEGQNVVVEVNEAA